MKKFKTTLKILAVTLTIGLATLLVPHLPSVAFAQLSPLGSPCTNAGTTASAASWFWIGGDALGCPIGLTSGNGQVWTKIWGASYSQTASVSLTAAQINGMFAAPVTILNAPVSGQVIVVQNIEFELVATSTAFASGGAVSFPYHGGSVSTVTSTIPAATVTTATPGTVVTMLGPLTTANGAVLTPSVGVDITNAGGAFTTGTGTGKVHIQYRVITQ